MSRSTATPSGAPRAFSLLPSWRCCLQSFLNGCQVGYVESVIHPPDELRRPSDPLALPYDMTRIDVVVSSPAGCNTDCTSIGFVCNKSAAIARATKRTA